ncbi:MAG: hypothetical protein FJ088_11670, partial [Deltaproteobacteria bacterium]|nr:hypothetical protein [Deltaproteobacteria bacterium]
MEKRRVLIIFSLLITTFTSCKKETAGKDAFEDALEVYGDVEEEEPAQAVKSLKEMINGEITEKVRFVFDKGYEGSIDVEALKAFALSKSLREADDFSKLTATEDWWEDYQDFAEILYYSAEHEFSEKSPYPGAVFMPHIWSDVVYRVSDVAVEFANLSELYAEAEKRKISKKEPAGTEWTLLNANDAFEWARNKFQHDPDEMVVIVTKQDKYK